jgi:hypothetical protein
VVGVSGYGNCSVPPACSHLLNHTKTGTPNPHHPRFAARNVLHTCSSRLWFTCSKRTPRIEGFSILGGARRIQTSQESPGARYGSGMLYSFAVYLDYVMLLHIHTRASPRLCASRQVPTELSSLSNSSTVCHERVRVDQATSHLTRPLTLTVRSQESAPTIVRLFPHRRLCGSRSS